MTVYTQSSADDSYGMHGAKFWGGDFTDETFHSENITQIEFYLSCPAGFTGTLYLTHCASDGSITDENIASWTGTITSSIDPPTTIQFTSFTATMSASGGYLFVSGDPSSAEDATEIRVATVGTQDPLSATKIITARKNDDSASIITYPQYPMISVTYGAAPPSTGETLMPPPIAWVNV